MTKWDLILPLRGATSGAKSRLVGARHQAGLGRALAFAFACDVATLAQRHPLVVRVAVVSAHGPTRDAFTRMGCTSIPDAPGRGLNGSLEAAAAELRIDAPERFQGVLVPDLPALTSVDLSRMLAAATAPRSVFEDARGGGTAFITAASGIALRPRFGSNSFAAHLGAGHQARTWEGAARSLRDVDTADDLADAIARGVGPHTAALLERLPREALTRSR